MPTRFNSLDVESTSFEGFELLHTLREYIDEEKAAELLDHTINLFYKQFHNFLNLKKAIDQSIIIGITDAYGRIIYVNKWFSEISKYERDELIGKTHRLLKSGHHDESFFKELWQTIKSGDVWQGEVKNCAKDGTYYWVKTTIVPLKNDDGIPEFFISLRTDITAGKQMQEQLLQALKNDYHQTIQSLDNIVFKVIKDERDQFIFTMMEGKLAKKVNYLHSDFYGKTPEQLFEKERADFLNEKLAIAFKGEPIGFKFKKDNLILFASLSPVKEKGKVIEVVGNCSDITSLESAQQKIEHMAYHDYQTNLPNKRKLELDFEELSHTVDRIGLVYIKLGKLRKITDSLGHSFGENVLKLTVARIEKATAHLGRLYRLEGSHVLFMVPSIKIEDIHTYVKLILEEVNRTIEVEHHKLNLPANIGISFMPEDGKTLDELMKKASIALNYNIHKDHHYYTYAEIESQYEESLFLETELRKAIQNNELTLHYQPKMSLVTGKVVGMEALVRWHLKDLGFISPAKFIPIAEEAGLIIPLGQWVMKEACRQNRQWIDEGYPPLKVAVNVSALELQHPYFINNIQEVLTETKLDPQYLEIEITENTVLFESKENINKVKDLREMGISVAIDDFGTGYSSLGYLKVFPVSTLKIDQSFVKDALNNPNDAALIKTMIHIAHTFNLEVVAEGVETEQIIQLLKEYNCEHVQGFYFSKPLPHLEFEQTYLINE